MSQDGHWADNLIIRATADALNVEIICTRNPNNHLQINN